MICAGGMLPEVEPRLWLRQRLRNKGFTIGNAPTFLRGERDPGSGKDSGLGSGHARPGEHGQRSSLVS
jgi:hypothetical protein